MLKKRLAKLDKIIRQIITAVGFVALIPVLVFTICGLFLFPVDRVIAGSILMIAITFVLKNI